MPVLASPVWLACVTSAVPEFIVESYSILFTLKRTTRPEPSQRSPRLRTLLKIKMPQDSGSMKKRKAASDDFDDVSPTTNNASLFATGEFSDLEIRCGRWGFKGH